MTRKCSRWWIQLVCCYICALSFARALQSLQQEMLLVAHRKRWNKAHNISRSSSQTAQPAALPTMKPSPLSDRIWKAVHEITKSIDHLGSLNISIEPEVTPEFVRAGIMPHGYRGNLDRFRTSFSYLLNNTNAKVEKKTKANTKNEESEFGKKPLTVCVIGGSMTWGPNMTDPKKSMAWPAQTELLLANTKLFKNVSFINMAIPGCPSTCQIMSISNSLKGCGPSVDLAIVDLAINDK